MKYLGIVLCINIMVIAYVWQNVEVMTLRMTLQDARRARQSMLAEHERILYEKERRRTMKSIQAYAEDNGYRRWSPRNIEAISFGGIKGK